MKKVLLYFVLTYFVLTGIACAVDLGWDANTDGIAQGYVLYWGESGNLQAPTYNIRIEGVGTVGHTVLEVHLKPNVEYMFWMKAYDSQDDLSGTSNIVTYTRVVVIDKVPPDNLPTEEYPVDAPAPTQGLGVL